LREVRFGRDTLWAGIMYRIHRLRVSIDDRIHDARSLLQRTPEWHPDFERRLLKLIRLVDQRDERQGGPPAAGGRPVIASRHNPKPAGCHGTAWGSIFETGRPGCPSNPK